MNVPNFGLGPPVDKNGNWTPEWQGIIGQLLQQLQENFSQEGLKPPSQPTATINQLNTVKSTSAIIYDSTTNQFKGCVNGVFKVFTLV